MRYLSAFARFWVEFVLGDDPRIAAVVVSVLALGAILVRASVGGTWLPVVLAALLILGFAALVEQSD